MALRWGNSRLSESVMTKLTEAYIHHNKKMTRHRKPRIMPIGLSLVALEVVVMTTSGASNDDKLGIMTTPRDTDNFLTLNIKSLGLWNSLQLMLISSLYFNPATNGLNQRGATPLHMIPEISQTSTQFRTWISNCIHLKLRNIITYPCLHLLMVQPNHWC